MFYSDRSSNINWAAKGDLKEGSKEKEEVIMYREGSWNGQYKVS